MYYFLRVWKFISSVVVIPFWILTQSNVHIDHFSYLDRGGVISQLQICSREYMKQRKEKINSSTMPNQITEAINVSRVNSGATIATMYSKKMVQQKVYILTLSLEC